MDKIEHDEQRLEFLRLMEQATPELREKVIRILRGESQIQTIGDAKNVH